MERHHNFFFFLYIIYNKIGLKICIYANKVNLNVMMVNVKEKSTPFFNRNISAN